MQASAVTRLHSKQDGLPPTTICVSPSAQRQIGSCVVFFFQYGPVEHCHDKSIERRKESWVPREWLSQNEKSNNALRLH